MLSTLDNPYNPWNDFDKWYLFDETSGYHTCSYLARLVATSPDISDEDQNIAINLAIDDILRLNLTGKYIKVYPNQHIVQRLESALAL
jgi:hypothetical protein